MSEGKNIKREREILKKEVAHAPLIDERDIQFGREPKTYKNTQNQNLFLCMLIFFSFIFLKFRVFFYCWFIVLGICLCCVHLIGDSSISKNSLFIGTWESLRTCAQNRRKELSTCRIHGMHNSNCCICWIPAVTFPCLPTRADRESEINKVNY